MSLKPRDVLRIWDLYTSPNKPKLHICVCDERQLFLRINSEAVFPPTHPLSKKNNPFLHHDSHVELQQLVRHMSYEVSRAEHVGKLSRDEAIALVEAVQQARTLSPEHKRLVAERLLGS
jgi:hypothetical protein